MGLSIRSVIAIISFVLLTHVSLAQHLDAIISFHTDKLAQDEKDFLVDLDHKLERAIESYRWEGAKRNYDLPVKYDLFWEKAARSGIIHNYTAGLLVSIESGVALRDKRAEFRYSQEDWLHLGEPYDPLTGLLEFYTWICLGFDADRLAPLGGNMFYQQARAVGERSRAEALFSNGWDDRRAMVDKLTESLYEPLRRARFHAEAGSYYAQAGNAVQAKGHLAKALKFLADSKWKNPTLPIDDHVFRFVDTDKLAKSLNDMKMPEEAATLDQWIKEVASEGEE